MPAPTNSSQKTVPTQPGERIEVIDILRGFALLGILLVNLMLFASPIYGVVLAEPAWSGPLDRAAAWFVAFFAEGKFFTLFSLLFGLGLAVQLQRAEAKGVKLVPRYLRRLLVLLAIGVAHVTLFWWGDILVYYALLGFPLLRFRSLPPRRLLAWAFGVLLIPFVLNLGLLALVELGSSAPDGAAQMDTAASATQAQIETSYAQAMAVYRGGDFGAMVLQRLQDYGFATFGSVFTGILFVVFAMFLVGLYVGKRQLLQRAHEHRFLFLRVLVWGAVLGLGGNALYATLTRTANPFETSAGSLLGLAGYLIGNPALSLCYASGVVLLTQSARVHVLLKPLAAVGRTALSNYLLQTFICTTLFYGYGLGLYGRIGPALGVALTLIIFGLQVPLSNWVGTPLPLRPGRVALALSDLWQRAADAPRAGERGGPPHLVLCYGVTF